MNKYYVFYSDDYADHGGEGWKDFDKKDEALEFIEDRLKQPSASRYVKGLSDYILIYGKELELKAEKIITKVVIAEL
jgi:hypothetical protein